MKQSSYNPYTENLLEGCYAYGVGMKERTFGSKTRYQFDGKEFDEETETEDYGMRTLDEDLGIFLTVDPLFKNFAWNSTYAFAENDVIRSIDLDGMEKVIYTFAYTNNKWSVTKLELTKAGPLGNGALVKFGSKYFYGNEMPEGTSGEDYTKSYEDKSLVGYKIEGEKGGNVTIGYGHLVKSVEEKAKYQEGTKITDPEADELFTKDYDARKVNIPGLTQEQNDAVTDARFKFSDTKAKIEKTYNSFEGKEKADFTLKGSATSFTGNKVRAASNYILYKFSQYFKLDYSKSAQGIWRKTYDKLTTPEKKK